MELNCSIVASTSKRIQTYSLGQANQSYSVI